MKRIFFVMLVILTGSVLTYAQKTVIDTAAFGSWFDRNDLSVPKISPDGRYVVTQVHYKNKHSYCLTIKRIKDSWSKSFICDQFIKSDFTEDSKIVLIQQKDQLTIVEFGKPDRHMSHINNYKISPGSEGFALLSRDSILTVTGKTTSNRYKRISGYQYAPTGNILIVTRANSSHEKALEWIDLRSGKITQIWRGADCSNLVFDHSETRVAFVVAAVDGTNKAEIYYYQLGEKQGSKVLTTPALFNDPTSSIANERPIFSRDGDKLLFQISEPIIVDARKNIKTFAGVKVWNYKDKYVPSDIMYRFPYDTLTKQYAVANLTTGKVIRINQPGENLQLSDEEDFENYFLVRNNINEPAAYYQPEKYQRISLVSALDGKRQLLTKNKPVVKYALSPNDDFAIWFDPDSMAYCSYEINSKKVRNITQNCPVKFFDEGAAQVGRGIASFFDLAGWNASKKAVQLYDKYDIWEISLNNSAEPVNITNKYGRNHEVVFSYFSYQEGGRSKTDKHLVVGYDRTTKNNGFWQLNLIPDHDPISLCMDPCAYIIPRVGFPYVSRAERASGGVVIKAKNAKSYIVCKETASDFPNYYQTTDFQTFKLLTNIHPQQSYNWLTSEIVTWKMFNGQWSQGILYKPENFDPNKKYPVIFDYYEKRSDELNAFLRPDWCYDRINIPYFVSNGYLVFIPDIYYYERGGNGDAAVNSVASAAKYLSRLPYVDSTGLGVQGHSFGGMETNYLVTHTKNLFAAACEASGQSDAVSSYNQVVVGPRQQGAEMGLQGSAYGVDVTPFTHPDLYLKNSSVLFVQDATTPLLIFHGEEDSAVPYPQGVEMFMAMKRAGKKVWFLDYPNTGHGVDGENAKDYTIRMKQFFDHYLKGAPPPKWMTEDHGHMTNTDSVYEIDQSGKQPQ